jgi:hypothetical protein
MAGEHERLRLGSCVTDRDSIFRILQELGEYCAQTEDFESLDEVLVGIDAIIDLINLRLDKLERPQN